MVRVTIIYNYLGGKNMYRTERKVYLLISLRRRVGFPAGVDFTSIEGFKQTFYDNMRAVNNVREAVGDYYNEHNK